MKLACGAQRSEGMKGECTGSQDPRWTGVLEKMKIKKTKTICIYIYIYITFIEEK